MKRFTALTLFCAFMATLVIPAIFSLLTTIQSVVPGATASPTLVAGILLMVSAMSGVTTISIVRRF